MDEVVRELRVASGPKVHPRRGARAAFGVGLVLWLLTAAFAVELRAQSLYVATQVDPCVPMDHERFEHLLNIELGTEPAAETSPRAATLTLSCSESLITVSVEDAITRKVVTRQVDLSAVDPSARARLMALTASELVLASWMEVRMEPREVIPPAGPPPAPELKAQVDELVKPEIQSALPPLRLGASATTSTFLSSLAPIFGVALHLTQPLSSTWAWNISLLGGLGHLSGTIGERGPSVSVAAITAALAWALRYTRTLGPLDVWVGGVALVGMAHLSGDRPQEPSSLMSTPAFGPWAGPALQLGAAYPIGARLRLLVQTEAGLLLLGSRARVNQPNEAAELVVTELRGGWLAAQLGFDVAL